MIDEDEQTRRLGEDGGPGRALDAEAQSEDEGGRERKIEDAAREQRAASYSPAPRRREVWLAQPCPVIMPTAARIMWSEKTMPSAATAVVPRVETK